MFKDIFGMDFCYFVNCFFLYSLLGYLWECFFLSLLNRKIVTDRGFVHGPMCTIYGIGAFGVIFILAPHAPNYILLFVLGVVSASLLEILTAVIMTKLFGYFWWDYTDRPFNFRGVISLESSLFWGLLSVCCAIFFHPAVTKAVNVYYIRFGKICAAAAIIMYCIDFIISFYQAYKKRDQYISGDEENDIITEMAK